MPDYLFVYGTLRDEGQLKEILGTGAEPVGVGTMRARLYRVAQYPGAKPSVDDSDTVPGEVFRISRVTSWRALDRYEETDPFNPFDPNRGLFRRERAIVRMSDGRRLTAWTYFYNGPTTEAQRLRPASARHARRIAGHRKSVVGG
jgi:gamma-glutamylcyclotransferase (GGCT)/AIG2-like uncharacterized protein YtfP